MDSLYHFIFALVGGYVLVKGMGMRYDFRVLVGLAVMTVLIDLDHIWSVLVFHHIFILAPPILLFFAALAMGWKRIQLYSVVLAVMFYGDLLADMTIGMGIPLFYPLDDSLYKLPYVVMNPNFISPYGLTLFLYFGLIALLILIYRAMKAVKGRGYP